MSKYLVLSVAVFLSGCFMDEESIVNNVNINAPAQFVADPVPDDTNIRPSLTDTSHKSVDYVMWFEK